MKLHLWYDKVKEEYLVDAIPYSPGYLERRFPQRDLVPKKDIEVTDPTLKRLILKKHGFIWISKEFFHELVE